MKYGCQSMVGKIKRLLLKHPKDAFINTENLLVQWKNLNYVECPSFPKAMEEYQSFVELLTKHVDDIIYLPENHRTTLDSIYTHDPGIVTHRGAILGNMGKRERHGEPEALGEYLTEMNIPILGKINGEGRLEGGDVLWIDNRTIAVGQGYRTNAEGIRQLRELTSDFVDEVMVVPLPHWHGPTDVLHLMSLISIIDNDLAVVFSKLLPVPFREWLLGRGIKLVEAPDNEYKTMAVNVLAVAPRKCIMLSGNPVTKELLKKAGAEVWEYKGDEISHKGAGGPTCLTRPILRE